MIVEFKGFTCTVRVINTPEGNSILLLDVEDGLPVATVTKSVAGFTPQPDQVLIKNYSENEGILDILIDAGVISKPVGTVKTGFTELHICFLKE